ncbi:MAG: Flp pilus assembly complex ATPase component TadA [Deltaproteobacteria bacterium]|nr:Flp pilus assembly complex ATPase component TadA [Deltaproteobacteria bacterium]
MATKKIGELLVESGLISQDQLEDALRAGSAEAKKTRLGSILVKKGYTTELDIAQTLSYQLNIPFVDVSSSVVDPEAVKLVSEKLAQRHLVIPLYIDRKVIRIAMADPLNLAAIDDIRFATGLEVEPAAATLSDVTAAIGRHYHINEPIENLMGDMERDELVEVVREAGPGLRDISEQVKKSSAPPIIKMVDSIIIHGAQSRASDVHIEPHEKGVKLRIRVDGIMKEAMQFPKWVQGPVVSRIKIMAEMDIAERRVSQDGRIKVRLGGKNLDIRVSTLPTQYGEKVVMRLLDPASATLDMDTVGLLPESRKAILDMIDRPQGVVLVTGPTGSGKTSMLYAMLRRIKSPEINIITIEDPIEYELKDVNQVAINEKTGLTFSYTLRSVLRQDPDVIMVGEMRDAETATIALQASLTGHLVFSTLHTNDAIASIIRLKNMGIPQYMVASSLNGIVAQRLVRVICGQCKMQYSPTQDELARAGIKLDDGKKLYRGAGCKQCAGTGYSGRTGVFEILTVTNKLKGMVAADAPQGELDTAATDSGMVTLQQDGVKKVLAGVTSLEELTRVIYLGKADEGKTGVCPVCHNDVAVETGACPHCGHFISKECPACGRMRQPGWVVCPYCTARF